MKLTRVDLGLDLSNVLTVGVYPRIDFSKDRIDQDTARVAQQIQAVFERVRALPGVAEGRRI